MGYVCVCCVFFIVCVDVDVWLILCVCVLMLCGVFVCVFGEVEFVFECFRCFELND